MKKVLLLIFQLHAEACSEIWWEKIREFGSSWFVKAMHQRGYDPFRATEICSRLARIFGLIVPPRDMANQTNTSS